MEAVKGSFERFNSERRCHLGSPGKMQHTKWRRSRIWEQHLRSFPLTPTAGNPFDTGPNACTFIAPWYRKEFTTQVCSLVYSVGVR